MPAGNKKLLKAQKKKRLDEEKAEDPTKKLPKNENELDQAMDSIESMFSKAFEVTSGTAKVATKEREVKQKKAQKSSDDDDIIRPGSFGKSAASKRGGKPKKVAGPSTAAKDDSDDDDDSVSGGIKKKQTKRSINKKKKKQAEKAMQYKERLETDTVKVLAKKVKRGFDQAFY